MEFDHTAMMPASHKRRAVYEFLIFSTLIGFGFLVFFAYVGLTLSSAGAAAFCFVALAGWLLFKIGRFSEAAGLVSFGMLGAACWITLLTGGFQSPILIWLSFPPLIVGFLVGARWSLFCGVIAILFVASLSFLSAKLAYWSELGALQEAGMLNIFNVISVASAVGSILFFSLQSQNTLSSLVRYSVKRERTDTLTGVLNRSGFNIAITHIDGSATKVGGALLLLDVDKFKEINDSYGHPFGDEVLKCISTELSFSVRSGDYVARIGGDEFAAILPGATHEQASMIAERIRARINERIIISPDGREFRTSVSIGVAICEEAEHCQAKRMMHMADKALYRAKTLQSRLAVSRIDAAVEILD